MSCRLASSLRDPTAYIAGLHNRRLFAHPLSPDTPDMSTDPSMSSDTPTPDTTPPTAVPPLPVSAPAPDPARPTPAFGWSAYAEQLNGRFAMIGFVALLILEFFTHQDFFTWLGLR